MGKAKKTTKTILTLLIMNQETLKLALFKRVEKKSNIINKTKFMLLVIKDKNYAHKLIYSYN